MPTNKRRRTAVASLGGYARALFGLVSLSYFLVGCNHNEEENKGAIGGPSDFGDRVVSPAQTGIQPGEQLDVFVMEDDSFSGRYQVRSSGDMIIPKLGRVKVGGQSIASAESSLKRALEKSQLKKATVILDRALVPGAEDALAEGSGVEVFLSGKVVHPGRYTMTGVADLPPTVHQAILQAGGCSRFAYKRKAYILRRSDDGRLARTDVDLLAIEAGEARDVPLATGDIIVIPEKRYGI